MMRIYLFLLMAGIASSTLWGQENAREELDRAFQLDWRGQFAQVIAVAKPLTTATTLTPADRGRDWMLLGHAYQEEGKFQDAETAYEQSLHLLENHGPNAAAYAATLSTFATLYRDMGKLEAAMRMEASALSLYEREVNHAGTAIACSCLADLALRRKLIHKARSYLTRALHEANLARGRLDDDCFASLSSTQAWLAELDHNPTAAISGYQHALALREHLHGEHHPSIGLGLMRLGKAYAEAGDIASALENMRKGLDILGQTEGLHSASYASAEMAYVQVLDASGAHSEARELKNKAAETLNNLYHHQCVQCRVSVAALY
jgi:tetratricopeptide (TPR) repeat protein